MLLPYANLTIKHQNPGASMPLILPVHLICNTADEDIHENIRVNSRGPNPWQQLIPEHDGVAVICGSGPSLADTLEDIRAHQAQGHKIFALNGAAKYLHDQGILADYQVILDARAETAQLVGPALHYLFASQVHPETLARATYATLWHLDVGREDLLPEGRGSYCVIGGAASVGNTSTCLAYAMGYRNLQIYGLDSSHRGQAGHAFRQPMNDGDPCAVVLFNGKEYTCSLTMKLQAEKFQDTSRSLRQMGCRIDVHGSGLLPDMYNAPREVLSEYEKYERMWKHAGYREFAPGEECAARFLEVAKPSGKVIDFGCGTGRGALKLKEAGLDVLLVDFTDNSRDAEAIGLPFIQHDLTRSMIERAAWGYCTDVMEHIPPGDVEVVICNLLQSAKTVFFQISTEPDLCGAAIGQDLHLTVRPHSWWRDLFIGLGYLVQWEEEQPEAALFLVTNR
jgi:hypothetical protein